MNRLHHITVKSLVSHPSAFALVHTNIGCDVLTANSPEHFHVLWKLRLAFKIHVCHETVIK